MHRRLVVRFLQQEEQKTHDAPRLSVTAGDGRENEISLEPDERRLVAYLAAHRDGARVEDVLKDVFGHLRAGRAPRRALQTAGEGLEKKLADQGLHRHFRPYRRHASDAEERDRQGRLVLHHLTVDVWTLLDADEDTLPHAARELGLDVGTWLLGGGVATSVWSAAQRRRLERALVTAGGHAPIERVQPAASPAATFERTFDILQAAFSADRPGTLRMASLFSHHDRRATEWPRPSLEVRRLMLELVVERGWELLRLATVGNAERLKQECDTIRHVEAMSSDLRYEVKVLVGQPLPGVGTMIIDDRAAMLVLEDRRDYAPGRGLRLLDNDGIGFARAYFDRLWQDDRAWYLRRPTGVAPEDARRVCDALGARTGPAVADPEVGGP